MIVSNTSIQQFVQDGGRIGREAAPAFCLLMMLRFAACAPSHVALALAAGGSGRAARAEVTRVDVARRVDLGASGYEKIIGTIHFAVDPKDPRNRMVVDLDKAPVNAAGRVEFSSDLYILRPKAPRGNGAALVDVLNRGNKVVLNGFNRGGSPDPATENDLGDRFLMRFGFTVVWVGWEFDLEDRPMTMKIHVPVAAEHGTITGIVRATFTANAKANAFTVTDLAKYDASDPNGPDSQLTARSQMLGGRGEPIPRSQWRVAGHTVTLDSGFEPGKTYEISYRAANPPVAGLGYVAVRDTTAWLKHQPDALAPVRFAYGYGSSQSGRFLRGFLYEGFNTDEHDRQVFDGVMAHIAGASRLSLNERWAKPTGLGAYNATAFPFADASLRDPVSGAQDGLLENARMGGHAPKVFYTNTPVEYWGTGRVAALVHTTPDGTADLPLPENVRVYFIAGTQHSPSRFPAEITNGQQPDNPVDYWWTMRALLLAMHKWVKEGAAPPPSLYPRLQDHTLVPAVSIAFPAIPGVASPRALTAGVARREPVSRRGAGAGRAAPAAGAGGRRGRQRARRHPAARRRGAARDLHRLELPQAGDRRAGRARLAAGIVDRLSRDARRARGRRRIRGGRSKSATARRKTTSRRSSRQPTRS